MKTYRKISTKIGELEYAMSGLDHVYMRGNVTVNRVRYDLSAHVQLVDGRWQVTNYRDIHLSRMGSFDGTSAARKKTAAALVDAWNAVVKLPGFKSVAQQAERGRLKDEIDRAREKVAELKNALVGEESRMAFLENQLASLTS